MTSAARTPDRPITHWSPMSYEHAENYIAGLPLEPHRVYCEGYLDKLGGRRKSLPSPLSKFGLEADQAKALRGAIDHELLKGVPVEVAPAPLPEVTPKGRIPARYSLSLIERAENCLLDASLSREFSTSGRPALLGTLTHDVCDVLAQHAMVEDLDRIPPAMAQAIANEYLTDTHDAGPVAQDMHEEVIAMVARWANTMYFWPDADAFLTEQAVMLELDGMTFSGRIDLVQVRGDECRIDDYKTGMNVPNQATFEKKLQTPFYARGIQPLFTDVGRWDVGEVWIRHDWLALPRISQVLGNEDLARLDEKLIRSGRQMARAWDKGVFKAQPGSHCKDCALPERCPVPAALRPDAAIESDEHVLDAIDWVIATTAQVKKVKKAVRGYLERTEQIEIPSRDGSMAATLKVTTAYKLEQHLLEQALRDGVDPDSLFRPQVTTNFDVQKAAA